jgi:hypothetical protein
MTEDSAPTPNKEDIKRAMKAFKKRLKLMRRDDESNLGGGAFSSGKASGIVAIQLPDGFAPEVWEALEKKGRIKRTPGRKTYELITPGS